MRVAFVADPSSPHTRPWVEAFAERGHEVFLFSPHKRPPPQDLPGRIAAPLAGSLPGRIAAPLAGSLSGRTAAPLAGALPGEATAESASHPRGRRAWRDPGKLRAITRALRLVPAFRRWLAQTHPDRLVALRFQPEGYLASWGGLRPYAIMSWGQDVLRFARVHPLHRLICRKAARRAALLIGETEPVVAALRGLAGADALLAGERTQGIRPPVRIELGWTGIDTAFWRPPAAGERAAARGALAAAHSSWRPWLERAEAGEPLLLSPRSVDRHGHQRELILALARLVGRGRAAAGDDPAPGLSGGAGASGAGAPPANCPLPILLQLGAGDPGERGACARLVERLGLGDRVHRLGVIGGDDLRRLYWVSDVAASLWSPDGLSQALLQALACGLTPVAADIPGNAAWLEEGRAGLLADPRDVEELAARLAFALEHPEWRAEAAARGRGIVTARADRAVEMGRLVELVLAMPDAGGAR